MQEARRWRGETRRLIEAEPRQGAGAGAGLRKVDVQVATLQLFGSVQGMWVWFDPDGACAR